MINKIRRNEIYLANLGNTVGRPFGAALGEGNKTCFNHSK